MYDVSYIMYIMYIMMVYILQYGNRKLCSVELPIRLGEYQSVVGSRVHYRVQYVQYPRQSGSFSTKIWTWI